MNSVLKLYVCLDNPVRSALVASGKSRFAPATPAFVLRDTVTLEVRFFRKDDSLGGILTQVDVGTPTITFAGKLAASIVTEDSFLFSTASFAKTTDGTDVYWSAPLNLNTEEFAAAFSGDTTSIRCELELTDESTRHTVAQFLATGIFDVIRGDEGDPTAATPPLPAVPTAATLLGGSDDGLSWVQRTFAQVWTKLAALPAVIVALASAGGSVALASLSALSALPTTGDAALPLNSIREVLTGSVAGGDLAVTRWVLMAGTNATDGVSYQRPADYAASTNEKVWVRIG